MEPESESINEDNTRKEWDGLRSRWAYEMDENTNTSLSTLRGEGGENAKDKEDR